jgi:PiT family inorganic phosphate transporter
LHDEVISPTVVTAGLFSAVLWNLVTWYLGLPSSSSHALVGGLLGAALLSGGVAVVRIEGLIKILVALLLSPVLGLLAGFLVMRLTLFAVQSAHPRVNTLFRRLQAFTLVGLALSHGTNDAQKTMGVIAMGLLASGYLARFEVPLWVIAASAGSIALGTSLGGWRLIRTLGGKIFRVRPVHGFASQVAGASVILGAALLGGPVSTTQVMSSAIMGVGAAERLSKVRWMVLRDLAIAWILTIPLTALLAAGAYALIDRAFL